MKRVLLPVRRAGHGQALKSSLAGGFYPILFCCLWLMSVAVQASPFIYALDSAVQEGTSGITNLVFTIGLPRQAHNGDGGLFHSDVSATAGDYTAVFGVAIFSPGRSPTGAGGHQGGSAQ
jgi:hypothetical protein